VQTTCRSTLCGILYSKNSTGLRGADTLRTLSFPLHASNQNDIRSPFQPLLSLFNNCKPAHLPLTGMGDAYVGAGAERITYCGVLYQIPGRFCGELPDMRMASSICRPQFPLKPLLNPLSLSDEGRTSCYKIFTLLYTSVEGQVDICNLCLSISSKYRFIPGRAGEGNAPGMLH
jgi:hypothetical protein